MWSLVHAMRMARQLQIDQVIFETDSSLVATAFLTPTTAISYPKPLLEEVLNLLNLPNWSASVRHCFREANHCADMLAKQGHEAPFIPAVVNSDYNFLNALLLLDCKDYSVPRLIS
jgi:ribonuclease HI